MSKGKTAMKVSFWHGINNIFNLMWNLECPACNRACRIYKVHCPLGYGYSPATQNLSCFFTHLAPFPFASYFRFSNLPSHRSRHLRKRAGSSIPIWLWILSVLPSFPPFNSPKSYLIGPNSPRSHTELLDLKSRSCWRNWTPGSTSSRTWSQSSTFRYS